MTNPTKQELYAAGKMHLAKFLALNPTVPSISHVEERSLATFATCAYYRSAVIYLDVPACASIGMAGMAWSAPGYLVDRTPYGVVAHELGHHVDQAHGSVPGILSPGLRALTQEAPITSYAPNTNEWFAEIFRLYITNPDLLRLVRPKMFDELSKRFVPAETRAWDEVLTLDRQRRAAANKIKAAERGRKARP